jgi:hypothetical protein
VGTLAATPEETLEATRAAGALARSPSGMSLDPVELENEANTLVGGSAAARPTTGARPALRGRPAGLKTTITLSACESEVGRSGSCGVVSGAWGRGQGRVGCVFVSMYIGHRSTIALMIKYLLSSSSLSRVGANG